MDTKFSNVVPGLLGIIAPTIEKSIRPQIEFSSCPIDRPRSKRAERVALYIDMAGCARSYLGSWRIATGIDFDTIVTVPDFATWQTGLAQGIPPLALLSYL